MRAVNFLLGKIKIRADFGVITELLNICMCHKIPYSEFKVEGDGASLCFTSRSFKILRKKAWSRNLNFEICESSGIPSIFERYKYRCGIILGVVFATVIIAASQMFVWSIDVTGNTSLTSAEVVSMLKHEGFGVGSYIPRTNTDRIENKIMIKQELIFKI